MCNKQKERSKWTWIKEKELTTWDYTDLQKEVAKLKNEFIDKEKEIDSYSNDSELLKSLYEKGIIDLDGNVIQ